MTTDLDKGMTLRVKRGLRFPEGSVQRNEADDFMRYAREIIAQDGGDPVKALAEVAAWPDYFAYYTGRGHPVGKENTLGLIRLVMELNGAKDRLRR